MKPFNSNHLSSVKGHLMGHNLSASKMLADQGTNIGQHNTTATKKGNQELIGTEELADPAVYNPSYAKFFHGANPLRSIKK
jgi:hypothetical protein